MYRDTNVLWLVRKYEFTRFVTYWLCFCVCFLLLGMLTMVSPKSALYMLKLVEPISQLVKDIFWVFVPQNGQFIRKVGSIFSSLGTKVLSRLSEEKQVLIQVGLLNGILLVTISAKLLHLWVMAKVRRGFVQRISRLTQ